MNSYRPSLDHPNLLDWLIFVNYHSVSTRNLASSLTVSTALTTIRKFRAHRRSLKHLVIEILADIKFSVYRSDSVGDISRRLLSGESLSICVSGKGIMLVNTLFVLCLLHKSA
jgi:hypothetical protein